MGTEKENRTQPDTFFKASKNIIKKNHGIVFFQQIADIIKVPREELFDSLKKSNQYADIESLLLENRDNLIPKQKTKDISVKEIILTQALLSDEFDDDGLHTIYTASEMLNNWEK